MKKLLGILVLVFILIGPSYAAEENTVTIDTTKVKDFFKTLTGKTLKKDDTIKFLNEYAITIEDERGNGVVTYIFDEHMPAFLHKRRMYLLKRYNYVHVGSGK